VNESGIQSQAQVIFGSKNSVFGNGASNVMFSQLQRDGNSFVLFSSAGNVSVCFLFFYRA
jgi:hypothetical protein